jgi:4'-phosphopantetheinyl transferase
LGKILSEIGEILILINLLPSNEIHLWLVLTNEINDAALISAYQTLMTPKELAKAERFHFQKDRHQHIITRALVRTTLSRYASIDPIDWRFSENEYGRPEILGDSPLRFNLSHTDGLIACVVVVKLDIGVDVENIRRKSGGINVAKRFFSPKEMQDLDAVPESQRQERFFDYWTLKESYIKARGMGLSLPLNQFSFHLSNNNPLRISFAPQLQDDPNQWQFWLLQPTLQHKLAISICNNGNREKYRLIINQVIPTLKL